MTRSEIPEILDEEKIQDVERGERDTGRESSSRSRDSVTVGSNRENGKDEGTNTKDEEGMTTATAPAGTVGDEEPEAGRTKLETTLVVGALCAALFLAAVDVSIITTAVPTISEQFNSNLGYIWVGSAYMLASAAFGPIWGKISDIWGRKPIMLLAIGVFWVGSLICGLSTSMGMLIAARAVQGTGGGGIMILVNICISDLFSMRTRGIYFGILGMVWAVASAIGPLLGGVFTSQVTWRWCFYINLPISGVGFFVMVFVLKLHNPRTPMNKGLAAIDWAGSALIIGGTIMFLFGLEFGGVSYPWSSPTVICLMVFGLVTIGLFFVNESKFARYPVIPPRLFHDRSNVAVFTTAFFHGWVFISGSYWLPLYFQGVLGVSSLLSGVYLLPYVLSLSFVSAGAGFFIRKTGNYKYGIVMGTTITVLGFGLFIDIPRNPNFAKIILYQIVAGIGIGPNFQSPLIALQTTVEPRDIASATSTFGFIRQIANAMSVVVGGVVFNNEMQKQFNVLVEKLGPDLANRLSGANAASSVGLVGELQGEQGRIAKGAYLSSLRTMYIVYTASACVGLIASLFIRQTKLSKDHKEHRTGLKTLRSREDRKAEK